MAIMQLSSTNPNFSYIIVKNPNTQLSNNAPFVKSIRSGKLHGWYNSDATIFNIWFKDSDMISSFSIAYDNEFEYLDKTRYCSALFVTMSINELLRSAVTVHDPLDVNDEFTHELHIPSVMMPHKRLNRALHTISDFHIEMVPILPDSIIYDVKITTTKSMHALLHYARLIFLLHNSAITDGYIDRTPELVAKFANSLNEINAPYYVRYLFVREYITSPKKLAEQIDLIQPDNMILNFGDTKQQRWAAISKIFTSSIANTILDVGCGELWQSKRLAKMYEQVVAIDENERLQQVNQEKVERSSLTNITVLMTKAQSVAEWLSSYSKPDILMSEIIEHMNLLEAKELLKYIKNSNNFNTLVITVPNKDFNIHYSIANDETRHDDHKWEPTFEEISDIISELFFDNEFSITGIGDSVDNVHVSTMITIKSTSEEILNEN